MPLQEEEEEEEEVPPGNSSSADDSNHATRNDCNVASGPIRAHALRLGPGDDVVACLQKAVRTAYNNTNSARSCFVMTAVGSLSAVSLRLASASRESNNNDMRCWKDERFEVVSLVGTFSADPSSFHLHMSISDAKGNTYGGHLVAGTVFTTMEIVLGTVEGVAFNRVLDSRTGYRELVVQLKPSKRSKTTQNLPEQPTDTASRKEDEHSE